MEAKFFKGGLNQLRLDGATRMDSQPDSSGAGVFLEEQVNLIDAAFESEILPPDDSNFLVQSVPSDVVRYQNEVRYRQLFASVQARPLGYRSNDVNTVGTDGEEYTAKITRPAAGMWIDMNESELARVRGFNLESFETTAVVNSFVDYRREMVFNGIASEGIRGFFGQGIKEDSSREETEMNAITALELYQLMIDAVTLVPVNSKQTFIPDRLVMPSILMARSEKLLIPDTDTSVMNAFLANNSKIRSIDQIFASSMLNNRTVKTGASSTRNVASLVAFRAGTQYARMRESAPRLLPTMQYLKGTLMAWENHIADVEVLQPNAFRIINFAGADPDTFNG